MYTLNPTSLIPDRINGIDISSAQGEIPFALLKEKGFEFVYIQCTRYSAQVDPGWERRRDKALEAGLRVGLYHFFSPTSPGPTPEVAQAEFFYKTSKGLGSIAGELPPMLDWENLPTCTNRPTMHPGDCVKEFNRFANACKQLWYPDSNRYPTVYTYPHYAGSHQPALQEAGELDYFPLTLASYTVGLSLYPTRIPDHPIPLPWTEWKLCQIKGNDGRIPGYKGAVDRLVFNGSSADWDKFCGIERPASEIIHDTSDETVQRP
jgi:lysozyme